MVVPVHQRLVLIQRYWSWRVWEAKSEEWEGRRKRKKEMTYAIWNSLLYSATTPAACLNAIDPHGSSKPGTG